MTQPRSCVQIAISDLDGEPAGTGAYYDGAGDRFELAIDDADVGDEDSSQDAIRAGVIRGTFSRSDGNGPSQRFQLSFTACSHPKVICLL